MRPRRFWKTLRPGQPSNVPRLVLYWVLTALLALALPAALIGMDMARLAADHHRYHSTYGPAPRGQTKVWLDQQFPLPPSRLFFERFYGMQQYSLRRSLYEMEMHWAMGSVAYVAWPWVTFLSLLVFQASMRRARARPAHVLRCVAYSFDTMALLSWMLLAVAGGLIFGAGSVPLLREADAFGVLLSGMGLLMVVVFAYRLAIAYRLYLQFPHARLTVMASQVLTVIALITALFVVANLLNPVRS